jgi:hypothetical protein
MSYIEKRLGQTADDIANSIVHLVEHAAGPVTLAQIARKVPGFAQDNLPAWEYFVSLAGQEMVVWGGMTEEGCAALRAVMSGRRVAVQYVTLLPYILEDRVPGSENWLPIVLLPKSAANLDTPNWLMRASPGVFSDAMAQAAKNGDAGYRPIKPRLTNVNSDCFAL